MQIRDGDDPDAHYTIIEISDMYRVIKRGGVARVREQLQSMYRRDLESGEIAIYYNEAPLGWEPDPIYEEPLPDGTTMTWKKDLSFEVDAGDGVFPVTGWVGIRRRGRARNAGFQLFQADRIVVGGPGQGWKPHEIFGAPNSFRSQRLLGELNLEAWPVSQTKDAFLWDGGLEETLIEKLDTEIAEYSQKAEDIRAANLSDLPRPTSAEAETVADEIEQDLSNEEVETALLVISEEPLPPDLTPEEELEALDIAVADAGEPTLVELGRDGHPTFQVWFLDTAHHDSLYMEMAAPQDDEIHMSVNLNHPFVAEVIGRDLNALRVYAHMLFADALVERALRRRGERTRPYRLMKDRMLRSIKAHRAAGGMEVPSD
jgi:hypothetical protein